MRLSFAQGLGTEPGIWINELDTLLPGGAAEPGIGFLPQEFGTYEEYVVLGILFDYQAILKGLRRSRSAPERLEYVLRAVHMFDRKDEKIGSFSGGMKQRTYRSIAAPASYLSGRRTDCRTRPARAYPFP